VADPVPPSSKRPPIEAADPPGATGDLPQTGEVVEIFPPSRRAPESQRSGSSSPPSSRGDRSGRGELEGAPDEGDESGGRASPGRTAALIAGMIAVPAIVLGLALYGVSQLSGLTLTTPTTAPSGTASSAPEHETAIAGRIVDDDGEPVEGAQVGVYSALPPFARLRSFTTTGDGVFSFAPAPVGRVRVIAEHDEKGIVTSAELTLTQGNSVQGLLLALGEAHTIRGTVEDKEGTPIAHATVTIDTTPGLVRASATDEKGVFRVSRVPRGATLAVAKADGFEDASVALKGPDAAGEEVLTIRLGAAPDINGEIVDPDGRAVAGTVVACAGQESSERAVARGNGRFRFSSTLANCSFVAHSDEYESSLPSKAEPGGRLILRLRPGGGIAGLVVDEDNSSIPAFSLGVESFTPAADPHGASVRSAPPKPFDDAGGAFKLEKLAPGRYVLAVSVEGRTPTKSSPIEVVAGAVTDGVRIVLPRGGAVEGQVLDEATKQPIANATVAFDATASAGVDKAKTTTGADGRYRLEGAPIGPFSLRIEHDGYRTRLLGGLRVEPKRTLEQDTSLTATDGGAGMEFGGIGASLSQTRQGITISSTFPGDPAERAGLVRGDRLRRIDSESVEGMSVSDAVQRLRGAVGSTVKITVERGSQNESLEVSVVRAAIVR
jgi:hypothetical protein